MFRGRAPQVKEDSVQESKSVVEQLERRQLLSVTVTNGVLTVTDTAATNQSIVINQVGTNYQVNENGTVSNFPTAGIDSFAITTGSGSDFIQVNAAFPNVQTENAISTGNGNDTVFGSPSNDVVEVGLGNCSVFGGAGADNIHVVQGSSGNDTLNGGPGGDIVLGSDHGDSELHGGKGNDMASAAGGTGHNSLFGGMGDDSLVGGDGTNLEFAGQGNDNLEGGLSSDTLIGGLGNDTLLGLQGRDALSGDNENFLPIQGQTAPDTVTAGNDSIGGGMGRDTLFGTLGSDTLVGGRAGDAFVTTGNGSFPDFPGTGDYNPLFRTVPAGTQPTATVNLEILVGSVPVNIPANAGAVGSGQSIAQAVSSNGTTARVEFFNASPTLNDFFSQWGIAFTPTGVGRQSVGDGHVLTMQVNGVNNTSFDALTPHNGDNIVISIT